MQMIHFFHSFFFSLSSVQFDTHIFIRKKQFNSFNCSKCRAKTICFANVFHNIMFKRQKITICLFVRVFKVCQLDICIHYSVCCATKKRPKETWNILKWEFLCFFILFSFILLPAISTEKKKSDAECWLLVPALSHVRGLSWFLFWFFVHFFFIL